MVEASAEESVTLAEAAEEAPVVEALRSPAEIQGTDFEKTVCKIAVIVGFVQRGVVTPCCIKGEVFGIRVVEGG